MSPITPTHSTENKHEATDNIPTMVTVPSPTPVTNNPSATPFTLPVRSRQSRSRPRSPAQLDFHLPYRTRDPPPSQRQRPSGLESGPPLDDLRQTIECPVAGCQSTVVHQHPPPRQNYSPRSPFDQQEVLYSPSSRLIPNTKEWRAAEERREMQKAEELARILTEEIERSQPDESLARNMADAGLQESSAVTDRSRLPSEYDPYLCISMQCIVDHPHHLGRYLARGHVPRTYNDRWGLSDPPHLVWEAWARINNGTAGEWDEMLVNAFSACHFWDGPEAANEMGERLLGRFPRRF